MQIKLHDLDTDGRSIERFFEKVNLKKNLQTAKFHENFPSIYSASIYCPPGILGIWGEWLFIFRVLGSTGNYLRGAGEQAHSFGDLGSPAKKQKK